MKLARWFKTTQSYFFFSGLVFPQALLATTIVGVDDQQLNDTQFFTLNPISYQFSELGTLYEDYDIEALDIHPLANKVYAASGDNTPHPGYLYQVDEFSGALTPIGAVGFKEIDGLTFDPSGMLWGWAQDVGLFTVENGIDNVPDLNTVQVVLHQPGVEVEDLTWNKAGTTLYGVQNLHNVGVDPDAEPDPGANGIRVWAYDTRSNKIKLQCEFAKAPEIELLETLPNDTLLFSYHEISKPIVGALDVHTCQVDIRPDLVIPYTDIEGLAWSEDITSQCSIPPYQPEYWNNNWQILFSNNCYNYGNNKRTDTYAQPGRASGIFLSWEDMNCEAVKNAALADGLVLLPASGVCPDTEDKVALVIAPEWDYHWYRQGHDGMWSHKPGGTPATQLDNSGKLITTPETADRGWYTDFCGYFCACSDKEQGQGHENIW